MWWLLGKDMKKEEIYRFFDLERQPSNKSPGRQIGIQTIPDRPCNYWFKEALPVIVQGYLYSFIKGTEKVIDAENADFLEKRSVFFVVFKPEKDIFMTGHITYDRFGNKQNDPAVGTNFRFRLKKGGSLMNKVMNGINLIAELVPGYTDVREGLTSNFDGSKYWMNVGLPYNKLLWDIIVELFKLHLK